MTLATILNAIGIRGGIAIAAGLACAFLLWSNSALRDDLAKKHDALVTEQALHAVTRASLDTLEAELQAMVDEGEARAERVAEAQEEAATRAADMQADIERIGAADVSDPCVTPDEILEAGL